MRAAVTLLGLTLSCAIIMNLPRPSLAHAGDAFATQETVTNPEHKAFVCTIAKRAQAAWNRIGRPELPTVLLHFDNPTPAVFVQSSTSDQFDKTPETEKEVRAAKLVIDAVSKTKFTGSDDSAVNAFLTFSKEPVKNPPMVLPELYRRRTTNISGRLLLRLPPLEPRAKGVDVDFGPYMADLQRRIKRKWEPPVGRTESSKVEVVFTIHQHGELSDLRLEKSSGDSDQSHAALVAVEKAAPFRPLPLGTPEAVDMKFTFDNCVYSQAYEVDVQHPDQVRPEEPMGMPKF